MSDSIVACGYHFKFTT